MQRILSCVLLSATLLSSTLIAQLPNGISVVPVPVESGHAHVVVVSTDAGLAVIDPVWPRGTATVISDRGGHAKIRLVVALGTSASKEAPDVPVVHHHALPLTGAATPTTAALAISDRTRLRLGDVDLSIEPLPRGRHAFDCVVWLPKSRTLCVGGLCGGGPIDTERGSAIDQWQRSLQQFVKRRPAIVIPAFGPPGDASLLDRTLEVFDEVRQRVTEAIAESQPMDAVVSAVADRASRDVVQAVFAELTRGPSARYVDRQRGQIALPIADPDSPPQLNYLCRPLPPGVRERARAIAPNVRLIDIRHPGNAREHAPRAHGCDASVLSQDVLKTARNLRWVQSWQPHVFGIESMLPALTEREITISAMRGLHSTSIAEHAFALLLQLTRRLEGPGTPTELDGKTLMIVGLGGVGAQVTERARAFGMRVIGVGRRPQDRPEGLDQLIPPGGLIEALGSADFVIVSTRRSPATRGLIDAEALEAMKPDAVIVDVSPDGIVDLHAVAAALTKNRLGGFAADLDRTLPDDDPIRSAPHTVLTFGARGRSAEVDARRQALFLENLRRFSRGEPILDIIRPR